MLEGVLCVWRPHRALHHDAAHRHDVADENDPPEEQAAHSRQKVTAAFRWLAATWKRCLASSMPRDLLIPFEGRPLEIPVSEARAASAVPDTTPVLRLLDQFKQLGQHLAIVIDEYGSVEGLVTMKDILEAIIGDLPELGQEADYKPAPRDGAGLSTA